ncbi:uncharacterized protein LOC125233678 [Leguminivora glycinivorella]|uniref:uncharacterized protein LOC125233678 n=1 Tax=Leguminivora glycinivorella TaxID=1035111 RepID=UPI00200FE9D6|nr:uncharacterized protein LOC125233678 [Leguminivora glycinivorella]
MELKQPPPLSLVGDLSQNFKRWEQRFLLYFKASGATTKLDKDSQKALLLHTIGDDALEVYNTLEVKEDADYNEILNKLREYCSPVKNETMQRHLFFMREKKESESVDEFVTALKTLSVDCNFDKMKDSLVKSQIIRGIGDTKLQEKLLQEKDLDLPKCISICKASEIAAEHVKKMATEVQVHEVNKISQRYDKQKIEKSSSSSSFQGHRDRNDRFQDQQRPSQSIKKQCHRCGYHHGFKCPAFGYRCKKCHRIGHYAKMCQTRSQVHGINEDSDDSDIVIGG